MKTRGASWRSRLAAVCRPWRREYDWPAYLDAMRRITTPPRATTTEDQVPPPTCVPCQAVMRCNRNGRRVLIISEDGSPYQLWAADEYRCPVCDHRLITGYGARPIAIAHEPGFADLVSDARKEANLVEARHL